MGTVHPLVDIVWTQARTWARPGATQAMLSVAMLSTVGMGRNGSLVWSLPLNRTTGLRCTLMTVKRPRASVCWTRMCANTSYGSSLAPRPHPHLRLNFAPLAHGGVATLFPGLYSHQSVLCRNARGDARTNYGIRFLIDCPAQVTRSSGGRTRRRWIRARPRVPRERATGGTSRE